MVRSSAIWRYEFYATGTLPRAALRRCTHASTFAPTYPPAPLVQRFRRMQEFEDPKPVNLSALTVVRPQLKG